MYNNINQSKKSKIKNFLTFLNAFLMFWAFEWLGFLSRNYWS